MRAVLCLACLVALIVPLTGCTSDQVDQLKANVALARDALPVAQAGLEAAKQDLAATSSPAMARKVEQAQSIVTQLEEFIRQAEPVLQAAQAGDRNETILAVASAVLAILSGGLWVKLRSATGTTATVLKMLNAAAVGVKAAGDKAREAAQQEAIQLGVEPNLNAYVKANNLGSSSDKP